MADAVEVKFGAQIGGLLDGVEQSKEAIEGLSSYIADISQSFTELAEAAGLAFAVDKLGEFEDKFGELGEQISRTAQITGESTDKVQEFSLATKLAGGDVGGAAQTLNILQKNIGDAISNAGRARDAFEGMGISLSQLKSTDVVTLLFQMKQRLDEAGNSADQLALKQDYMRTVAGRSAAQFLALGLSLEQVKKIAEETGYIMSPQIVGHAKELEDSTHTLGAAWTGLSNNLADKVSPAYQHSIDLLTQLIEKTNELVTANDNLSASDKPYDPTGMLKHYEDALPPAPAGRALGEGQFGPQPPPKPLPPLETDSGKGDNSAVKIAQNDAETELEIQKVLLQGRKDLLDQEVSANQISKQEELRELQSVLDAEYQASYDAIEKELAVAGLSAEQKNALLNKEQVLTAEYFQQSEKLSAEAATAQMEDLKKIEAVYKSFFDTIDRDMDTVLAGILQGTTTWQSAMARTFSNLATGFIEELAKMTVKWAAFEASQAAFGVGDNVSKALGASVPTALGGTQQNSVLNAAMTKLGALIGINTAAHTAGTLATTGNTVATTVDTTATGASTVAATAGTLATTVNTTTTASTGLLHVAAMAENTLATAANTIATWAGDTFHALIPLATGAWNIPADMPAYLHAGEMVIPAQAAAALRSGGNLGSAGSGGGGAGQFTININAIDTQTAASFLKQNAGVIAQSLSAQSRNFNPNFRA